MNFFIALVAFLSLIASARASSAAAGNTHCPVYGSVGKSIEWDYSPMSGKGPLLWGAEHPFCKGSKQSPANFPSRVIMGKKSDGPKPTIKQPVMRPVSTNMNFAMICPEPGTCGSTVYKGRTYNLANIHFHNPSEHTLNGKYYPLEAHIVHTGGDGTYAVLGVMFDYPSGEGYAAEEYGAAGVDFGTNDLVKRVIKALDEEKTEFVVPISDIVVPEKGYCTYAGSLTTPPCTEAVTWLMSLHVATVSKRQVHSFAVTAGAGYDGNNRPLQKRNGRDFTCYIR